MKKKKYRLTMDAKLKFSGFNDHTFSVLTLEEWEGLGIKIHQLEEVTQ